MVILDGAVKMKVKILPGSNSYCEEFMSNLLFKAPISEPALLTWIALNEHMRTASEEECRRLLTIEAAGRARKKFMQRLHSRLNRVRAQRERDELAYV